MNLAVLILAAGQGTRMLSNIPKVLQPIAGKPQIKYVLDTANNLVEPTNQYLVFGCGGQRLKDSLTDFSGNWLEQKQQLGTGHALLQFEPYLENFEWVLVLYGDVPLITSKVLKSFVKNTPKNTLGLLTTTLDDPAGYGRILRNKSGNIIDIIEEKDADETVKKTNEINTGIFLIPTKFLSKAKGTLKRNNSQNEYYLTDLIKIAISMDISVYTETVNADLVQGVNDKLQLAQVERLYQKKKAEDLLKNGVTLADPNRIDIRGDVKIGQDTAIDIDVILEGSIVIGKNCQIGPFVHLKNVVLADNVRINSHSMLEGCVVGDFSEVGPFSRIRPKTRLAAKTKIGNFVELKNAKFSEHAKANHLSYLGDVSVGEACNIGAGTITCNYDGFNKHPTVIGKQAFIGSNVALVAPLEIGDKATIGAGSVITKNVPDSNLAINRGNQKHVQDWSRSEKNT